MSKIHQVPRSVAVVAAVAFIVLAAVVASAILPGSPSNFESNDGNMIVNGAGNHDWANVPFIAVNDPFNTTSDNSFTPGQKQDSVCPDISGHKNPGKDDFKNVASYSETAVGGAFDGDVYAYGATIRYSANGDASENIELKRSSTLCPGQPAGGLTQRSADDVLIAIDYKNAGTDVDIHVLKWVTSGACFVGNDSAPCWGANPLTLADASAEGAISAGPITAANNPISNVSLQTAVFAEFGINLTDAGIVPAGECELFAQAVWESRSSGSSFVSSTKDITIENRPISNCATVEVNKVGSDGGSQAGAVFTLYEGSTVNGTVVGTCLVDANGDCNPLFSSLNPGTYTIDETTVPPNYTKDASLPLTFTLVQGQDKVLNFTDTLNTGAIEVVKTAKHADTSGNTAPNLAAGFTVTDSNGDTHTLSTDGTTGLGCIDGLVPGSATVSETTVPDGYAAGADKTVTVVGNTTCANADGVTASFVNTPLTDVTVSVDSQVPGGTSSTVTCDDPDASTMTTGANGDGSLTMSDQKPSTITCTILIDP